MAKEEKLDWIYKSANSLVEREEYLLGRKVDKTLEQINEEEKEKKFVLPTPKNHVEHECIPPSIRDFNKIVLSEQVDLSAKLQEDPLVAIKKREEEARRQFLQNPVQLKKLQEALRKQEEQKKKHKKLKKKKHSDEDLDRKLKEKLMLLRSKSSGSGIPNRESKKNKKDVLDTILMHKFNALKDKLSEDDLKDILNGKVSDDSDEDRPKKKKNKKSLSSDSDYAIEKRDSRKKTANESSHYKDRMKHRSKSSSSDSDRDTRKGRKTKRTKSNSTSDTDEDIRNNSHGHNNLEKSRRKGSISPYRKEKMSSREKSAESRLKKSEKRLSKPRNEFDKYRKRNENKRNRSRSSSRGRSESNEREFQSSHRKTRTDRYERKDSTKKKYSRRVSSSSDTDERRNNEPKTRKKGDDNSDLDEKILAKLKILRDEVEGQVFKEARTNVEDTRNSKDVEKNKRVILPAKPPHLISNCKEDTSSSESTSEHRKMKTLLPDKPSHLKNQSSDTDYSSSEEESHNSRCKHDDSDEEKKQPKLFGLVTSDGKKIELLKRADTKSTDSKSPKKIQLPARPEKKQVKKLTEKEKQKLREEMMHNAVVRDKERETNVKRYQERDRKEEEMVTSKFDGDLIHTELLKSAKHTSVEQRIKSKLNNIQRSSRHMDSNFSKR